MAANNPYAPDCHLTVLEVPTKFNRLRFWLLIAWAIIGPVALFTGCMYLPYAIPTLQKTQFFQRGGQVAICASLVAGYLAIAFHSFSLKVDRCCLILFSGVIYFLAGYGLLFIIAISMGGLLFNRYL